MVSSFFPAASLAVLFQCLPLAHSFTGAFSSHGRLSALHTPTVVVGATASSWPHISHLSSRTCSTILTASNDNDSETSGEADNDSETTDDEAESNEIDESIDITTDPRLRRIRLSRALGIDWGTDLSFSFVYVRDLEPSGAASVSGVVEIGDQICELRPVEKNGAAVNLIGAPFDEVMGTFASLGREVREVELVFFRGTKEELKAVCAGGTGSVEEEMITITVVQNKGAKDEAVRYIEAKAGCNVRQVLTDNDINVYQSLTRWTNCKGKQLCGTCIVNVVDGEGGTNRKSLDEGSTLRENPDSYRLSCVTFAYGDVTVETFPPIKAAQWTR